MCERSRGPEEFDRGAGEVSNWVVVLYGSAPDYGAYEYDPGAAPQVTGSFGGNLR